jgi:DNA mismatch repair ATPase MutS
MLHNNPREFYQARLLEIDYELSSLKQKLFYLAWLRGIVFFIFAFSAWVIFKSSGSYWAIGLSLFFLGAFLFLIQKNEYLSRILFDLQNAKKLNSNELSALNNNFDAYDKGQEYIQTEHDYAYDMDVFGEKSLYQILIRCFTKPGKQKLAHYLKNIFVDQAEIVLRQNAASELSKLGKWREKFGVLALRKEDITTDYSSFSGNFFHAEKNTAKNGKFGTLYWKISAYTLSIASILLLILSLFGSIPSIGYFYYTLLILGIISTQLKYINFVHKQTESLHKTMQKYALIIQHIEETDFESEYIKELQNRLITHQTKASTALKQYASYLKMLDNRLNFLFAILSNAILLWDIHLVRKVEHWNQIYGENLTQWIDVIAEFEYLNSIAAFSFNHPEYCIPQFSPNYSFYAQNLGHMAIPQEKCITNDFIITENLRTFIITGANMAGKSTFLRTFGTNLILAQIGAVVFASEFIFKPIRLITSIRISDSLTENESYFYAELKRLKYIVEEALKEPPVLIIIDEMLRGTNSGDKHKGSEGLLKRLTTTNNFCMLATHDVALGSLEHIFSEKLKNICFEAEIRENELYFDYKLRNGVSKNLNATFLMQKMNIIEHNI